ncbi:glycoside hydrolase family 13 /Carbohydrate-binding module family 20 [Cryphonectria parasitica EP155]|uniref:alpha-amylase n=1 Tax=Cryphonectria parasitica (strain ATCC 38755 / EP155) TaxID=660469 RepID=A0A9P4YAA0_CRYP1|nr:glycoside hydrolase family 13 /Carbohydrate-binding module family 20 [Cryphonectria parasitica EP155]KAF3768930.1 glycoside hydrolase family 13 /Carbohydrate-binding module family 20 [Cryphonectria parasitica EP155]
MSSERHLLSLLVAAVLAAPVVCLSPAEWRSQSIYQVMTDRFARTDLSTTATCDASDGIYCGGTWEGLISKLDYIQDMGFTAVWVSPFVAQMEGDTTDGESYHGYWAQDIYSVNSNFGSASDLKALSTALHDRGMYLMMDVVTNHFAYDGSPEDVDYSMFSPFNSSSHFHSYCEIDYDVITSIQDCWEGDTIVPLPDLATENEDVYSVWYDWIADVVSTYGIDGIRLDSAYELNYNFTPGFEDAAGVYLVGEVADGDPTVVTPYQQYMSGVLNYPAFYWITQAFESSSGSISNLVAGINEMKADTDTTLYGSFLENQDQPRFPSLTSDYSLAKTAIAFTMLADGIPIIYQGQEQHCNGSSVPDNREAIWLSGYDTTAELYTWIASLNAIRNWAIYQDSTWVTYQTWPIYSDTHTIGMRKGNAGKQIVGVYSNVGSSGSTTITLEAANTGFTAGQALIDVMSCTAFTADSSGDLSVSISEGVPRIFYPTAALSGCSLCGEGNCCSRSMHRNNFSKTGLGGGSSTTTTGNCTSSSVAITFDEIVSTTYGTTIKISGDISTLGDWDTSDALALSASQYTSSDPLWDLTVDLTPGAVVEYKFISVDSSGDVTWEADPNHTLTVPCSATTVSASWQT